MDKIPTDEDILLIELGITEQELEKEALMMLEASDDEFESIIAPHKEAIEQISKRMMTADQLIEVAMKPTRAGNSETLDQAGNSET